MPMERCMNRSGWHPKSWLTLISQKEGKPDTMWFQTWCNKKYTASLAPTPPQNILVIIKSQPCIWAGLYSSDKCIGNTGMEEHILWPRKNIINKIQNVGNSLTCRPCFFNRRGKGNGTQKTNRELFRLRETQEDTQLNTLGGLLAPHLLMPTASRHLWNNWGSRQEGFTVSV